MMKEWNERAFHTEPNLMTQEGFHNIPWDMRQCFSSPCLSLHLKNGIPMPKARFYSRTSQNFLQTIRGELDL
ncbi:cellulose synthase A catalytic subunit 3 [UDP-forming]-like [Gossypium australe]|uniref:Cellulose synthase A catalytic subunit 3 [UDP-forming]-like n=1 Tax=Gossypium australe TaxID=47621 RepID=A0A5B6VPZ7_9ROSI|nr:cellulose synthase A catalytic subunit 3 [UDP-forming]-like [Gossypium australe]